MRFLPCVLLPAQYVALRPEMAHASTAKQIASIGELLSHVSTPLDALSALHSASGIVGSILGETSNATEHMSDDDADLLRSVITLVEDTIYTSMDSSEAADTASLNSDVAAIQQCNDDIAERQSSTGDLGEMKQSVTDKQVELNTLQGVVDEKTAANSSAWTALDTHMHLIGTAPTCAPVPPATVTAMDSFFETSEYVTWYTGQQSAYSDVRSDYTAADEALTQAIADYNVQLAVRDTQFCDWKLELKTACALFDTCYADKTASYENELVPRVTNDMNNRIEVHKAGETLIHQIKFLLGDVDSQDVPEIASTRYQMEFPVVPAKGDCDMSVLDDPEWVPVPFCGEVLLEESFESVGVTEADGDQTLCANGNPDSCSLSAWHNPTHPSYVQLTSDVGRDWSTPFGHQALRIFGYQRCPNQQPCGVKSSAQGVSERITAGYKYVLTFNVAANVNFGDYQVELTAVDDSTSSNWRDWTETTVATVQGTAPKTDFSTHDKVVYVADASSPVGKRLGIRLLDRDEGDWGETPVYDNIRLTRELI